MTKLACIGTVIVVLGVPESSYPGSKDIDPTLSISIRLFGFESLSNRHGSVGALLSGSAPFFLLQSSVADVHAVVGREIWPPRHIALDRSRPCSACRLQRGVAVAEPYTADTVPRDTRCTSFKPSPDLAPCGPGHVGPTLAHCHHSGGEA